MPATSAILPFVRTLRIRRRNQRLQLPNKPLSTYAGKHCELSQGRDTRRRTAMGRRSTHTPQQLRELILDAAQEIIQAQGLAGLSAREIARRIEYSPGTIYNMFENLDDVVLNVEARVLDALDGRLIGVLRGDGDRERTRRAGWRRPTLPSRRKTLACGTCCSSTTCQPTASCRPGTSRSSRA